MHFSDEIWSDFVRGTATAEIRRQVERHLAEACIECKQQQSTWTAVVQTAKVEKEYTPADAVVRRVEQEFTLRKPRPEPILARLIFDTFAQPQMAGVRSAGTLTARQVLYEAGGIAVDLRLESRPGSDQVSAVGQVQDRSARAFLRPHLPVALVGPQGDTLMQVTTNEFGEFQFEFGRQGVARVAIEVDANRTIVIPLSDLQGYLHSS